MEYHSHKLKKYKYLLLKLQMYIVKLPPAKVTFTHFTTKSGQEQVSHLTIYYLGYEILVNTILDLGDYIPPIFKIKSRKSA